MKIQVNYSDEALKTIDYLKKRTGVKDRGIVLVDALKLYKIIEENADENGKLIIGKNKEKEITISRPK